MTVTITTQGSPVNIAANSQTISLNVTAYDQSSEALTAAAVSTTKAAESLASSVSAAASSASAGVASGRLVAGSFADMMAKYVTSSPSSGQVVPATGDLITVLDIDATYRVVTSGQHITTTGGVKLVALPPYSVMSFNAIGNGLVDDTAEIGTAVSASENDVLIVPRGEYAVNNVTLVYGGSVEGYGSHTTTLRRTGTSNLITAANRDGDRLSGLTLDLDRNSLGNISGHGISASGNDLTFSDIVVKDYGSNGTGGGTGILVIPGTFSSTPERIRMIDCNFMPDPTATISVGWLYEDAIFSFASRIYADNVVGGIGYAHELKDRSQFNSLDQLIASYSNVALAYGQTTTGIDGANYNVATNIVAASCDLGLLIGEGFGNVTVGMVHVATGSPENSAKTAVSFVGGANQNYAGAVSAFGVLSETVRISGSSNTVEVAAHDTSAIVALFDAGSANNFVNVVHPGTRTSVRGNITDNSGNAINSTNANVVHSPVTGERVGSVQGRFWDKLGNAGITPPSSHNWVYESNQFNFQSLLTQGNAGDISGISVSTSRDGQNEGRLWHVTGATEAENYWTVAVGGSTDVIRIYSNNIRLGSNGPRWQSGAGSPEGSITAPVGSLYSRTDGGAGTTLYIKESGTGNIGWVAK